MPFLLAAAIAYLLLAQGRGTIGRGAFFPRRVRPPIRVGRGIPASELGPARGPLPPNLLVHGVGRGVATPRRVIRPVDVVNDQGQGADFAGRYDAAAQELARESSLDPSRATFNGPMAMAIARGLANIALGFTLAPAGILGKVAIQVMKRIPGTPIVQTAASDPQLSAGGLTPDQQAALQSNYKEMIAGLTPEQAAALGIDPARDPVSIDPNELSREALAAQQQIEANISSIEADLAAKGFSGDTPSAGIGDNLDASAGLDLGGNNYGGGGGAAAGADLGAGVGAGGTDASSGTADGNI